MPAKKPLVIVTRKLPDAIETRMRELFDARLNLDDTPMSQADLIEAVQKADVLVPTVTDRIDSKVIVRAGPNLKLIANFGTGVDNIDVKTALDKGITVTNTPGVLTEDTADMTMALILAVPRRLVEGVKELEADHFKGWSPSLDAGPSHLRQAARHRRHGPHRPGGGAARQGVRPADPLSQPQARACRHRARARGDLLGEPRPDAGAHGHRLASTARTRRRPIICLSARRLKLMKPTAYIVNTARGEVIDENTLARMLEAGQLSGAGLDVFEHEPAVNPKLLEAQERGAAAAYGLGHDRRPHRHGREGHHQHQDLRRRPQTAGPRHPGDALDVDGERGEGTLAAQHGLQLGQFHIATMVAAFVDQPSGNLDLLCCFCA